MSTHNICFCGCEALLMSNHNICFCGEISKLSVLLVEKKKHLQKSR